MRTSITWAESLEWWWSARRTTLRTAASRGSLSFTRNRRYLHLLGEQAAAGFEQRRIGPASLSRSFSYSSLGRLLNSLNPESGSISYSYDNDGKVLTKSDPLVTTCWGNWSAAGSCDGSGYDSLNEAILKSYSDGTPAVRYSYTNGRLMSVGNNVSATSFTYDGLGRISASSQQTLNQTPFSFQYAYNLTDALTSETYPSGRVVTTNYDGANRVSSITGAFNGSIPTYANNIQYSPHGAETQVMFGNAVWHTKTYNSRLQMSGFVDDFKNGGSAASQYNHVTYNWGATVNNGNLMGASWNFGGAGAASFTPFSQTFTYDTVNRIKTASDTGGWSRNYYYDAYGNMAESGSGVGFDVNAPVTGTQSVAGLYNANNQLTVAGMSYNAAGDLSGLSGYSTLTYDGENRLTGAGRTGGVTMSYKYDGEGRRVVKLGGGSETIFVYDAAGRMAAEYSTAVDTPNCVTCYLSADHLGTARLITDQNGLLVSRHDYLPFGEEIGAGQAGRTSAWGPSGDSINQKFTGKERDSESGFDYFGARYYGSGLGRFTSPDWSASPEPVPYADLANPQTLNQYSYTGNNPLARADSDGHCPSDNPNCNAVKVETESTEAKIVKDTPIEGEPGKRTGVEASATYKITENGKPLADTPVKEANNTSTMVDGKPLNIPAVHGPGATDDKGNLRDDLSLTAPADPAHDNALVKALSTQAVVSTDKQIMTFKTPSGATCSATSERVLTNVGANGKPSGVYNVTAPNPVVRTVGPVNQ